MEVISMAEPMRLVFMGSDPVGLPLLNWLAGEGRAVADLVGIFTGPDRPSGRGQAVGPNCIKKWSHGRPVEVRQPERLDGSSIAALSALRPDVALVVAYGHILRDEVISVPRLGTLNLHASLLPSYRGASPIQAAVASGDRETGMSLMRIVRELDAGPVGDVERVPVSPLDTAADVEERLALAAVVLCARALPLVAPGELVFRAQDRAQASFCRRLSKADSALDFSAPAPVLSARINALHPWPSAVIPIGGADIKLGLADAMVGGTVGSPGCVLGSGPDGLLVAAGSGVLRVRRLQRPGGRMLPAPEFLRGFPVAAGTVIPSRPMAALVASEPFRR
jgi:methionyl-tRNA formyltransferase